MSKVFLIFIIISVFSIYDLAAQTALPDFLVRGVDGKITLIWWNKYNKPVKGISIQRSADSSKFFSTIGSVSNPQKAINSFIDPKPFVDTLFYRLFISFDSGHYVFTRSKKPETNPDVDYAKLLETIKNLYEQNRLLQQEIATLKDSLNRSGQPIGEQFIELEKQKPSDAVNQPASRNKKSKTTKEKNKPAKEKIITVVADSIIPVKKIPVFPSKRIFTDKENNVIVSIAKSLASSYVIKFYNDKKQFLFKIENPTDEYFTIEKVNFERAGWYLFEIYENDILLEENKFHISTDEKNRQ